MATNSAPESFVAGRYRVIRLLGEGGSKVVYLARDTSLDREVAFALIKIEGLDENGRTRIAREARSMGRLGDHPHIVNIYDVGEERGQPYIVSQYMQGGSVDDLLGQSPNHRLPVSDAVRIAREVSEALAYAHSLGIVHRDLKPANVWLTKDGTSKLGDFGLAIATDLSRLTPQGIIVGTVAYMPPEQATGKPLVPQSDLYSLGAMLYEMVTGNAPFRGNDLVSIIAQLINSQPKPVRPQNAEVPQELETLILWLLAKAPAQRPASATAVREELGKIAARLQSSIDTVAGSVVSERPDLSIHASPEGTVSILFSDIENSTVITEALGDLEAQNLLHQHNAIIREQLSQNQGYEVKSMGDGFMVAFSSARRALKCAIGIQRAFAEFCQQHPEHPLRVRIGLHTGEAIREAGDFFGKAVILAARIGAKALGGEILVSSTFKEVTDSFGDFHFDQGREVELKGLSGQQRVYRVLWQEGGPQERRCPKCSTLLAPNAFVCSRCSATVGKSAEANGKRLRLSEKDTLQAPRSSMKRYATAGAVGLLSLMAISFALTRSRIGTNMAQNREASVPPGDAATSSISRESIRAESAVPAAPNQHEGDRVAAEKSLAMKHPEPSNPSAGLPANGSNNELAWLRENLHELGSYTYEVKWDGNPATFNQLLTTTSADGCNLDFWIAVQDPEHNAVIYSWNLPLGALDPDKIAAKQIELDKSATPGWVVEFASRRDARAVGLSKTSRHLDEDLAAVKPDLASTVSHLQTGGSFAVRDPDAAQEVARNLRHASEQCAATTASQGTSR